MQALDVPDGMLSDPAYVQLPRKVKDKIDWWKAIMDRIAAAPVRARMIATIAAENAGRVGCSAVNIENRWLGFRKHGWAALVDGRLAGTLAPNRKTLLTPLVIDDWHARVYRHQRKAAPAYRELVCAFEAGEKIGDVDWTQAWAEHYPGRTIPTQVPPHPPLPRGWSYETFMRRMPKKRDVIAARVGARAAATLHYQVHTTRVGLEPGMAYVFDDMWQDMHGNFIGQNASVRVLELGGSDMASGFKFESGFTPLRELDDGARRAIGGREMRFYLAHILCNVGYHKNGVALYVEHGTAAIREDLRRKLELCDGRITFRDSGIEGVRQSAQLFRGSGKGNPRLKAGEESLHNLQHNYTDHLPAQIGKDRDHHPESFYGRDSINTKLLLARYALSEERQAMLRFPVMEWNQLIELIRRAYHNMNRRTEHDLEGWIECGYVKYQWRFDATSEWFEQSDLDVLPPEKRAFVEAVIHNPDLHRVLKMSPWDVWSRGQASLVRLPQHCTWDICGQDLAVERPCPDGAEIGFLDQRISPSALLFETIYVDLCGRERPLQEGRSYRWMINPFDPRTLYVGEANGAYLGTCPRIERAGKLDVAALEREYKHAAKRESEAIAEHLRINRKQIKARIEDAKANAAALSQAPVTPTEKREASEAEDLADAADDAMAEIYSTSFR